MSTDFPFDGAMVWVYPSLLALLLVALWFVRPLHRHVRGHSSGP